MATEKATSTRKRKKALSAEARESQIIALVIDKEEERIRSGKATSQELCYWMKLASSRDREKLEREKLERENELLLAKVDALRTQQRTEEFYQEVLDAFMSYRGDTPDNDSDDEY